MDYNPACPPHYMRFESLIEQWRYVDSLLGNTEILPKLHTDM